MRASSEVPKRSATACFSPCGQLSGHGICGRDELPLCLPVTGEGAETHSSGSRFAIPKMAPAQSERPREQNQVRRARVEPPGEGRDLVVKTPNVPARVLEARHGQLAKIATGTPGRTSAGKW